MLRLSRRLFNLRLRKIFDAKNVPRLLHVAQLGPCKLIGHRPRGEHSRAGIALAELGNAGHLKPNDACVSKVIFRRESIRWIDEQAEDKRRRAKCGQPLPVRNPAIKSSHRDQQHQRIHRQQIAREQRTAQHAEQKRIHQQEKEDLP